MHAVMLSLLHKLKRSKLEWDLQLPHGKRDRITEQLKVSLKKTKRKKRVAVRE